MRPRAVPRRLWRRTTRAAGQLPLGHEAGLFLGYLRAANRRGFSWAHSSSPRTRPQLPFLAIPSSGGGGRGGAGAGAGGAGAATAGGSAGERGGRRARYFTTQRRQWLRYEALAFTKYTLYFWVALGCVVVGQFVVQQEWLEQANPTPPEWTFLSRMRLRGALGERQRGSGKAGGTAGDAKGVITEDDLGRDVRIVDHVRVIQILTGLLERLEDARIDGRDLECVGECVGDSADGPFGEPAGLTRLDLSHKSEPWRRGYFEALLAAAETAEHVEGWVRDRSRGNVVCPPDLVVGPSNPHPRPLPPGSTVSGPSGQGRPLQGAPREENCEPSGFPHPSTLYLKLLGSRGFSARQQITAALAFANYLEYKHDADAAAYIYGCALGVAVRGDREAEKERTDFFSSYIPPTQYAAYLTPSSPSASPFSSSQNLIDTLTAYATFLARSGQVDAALPVFVALLQTRRSLPPGPGHSLNASSPFSSSSSSSSSSSASPSILSMLRSLVTPPAYPPPPDDGFGPPLPGPRARCAEAALQLHIGEILYASAGKHATSSSWSFSFSSHQQQVQHTRNEGIAWTREAVDVAEEQLHALQQEQTQPKMQKVAAASSEKETLSGPTYESCRQCLITGLDNWTAMVRQLARDEEKKKKKDKVSDGDGSSSSSSSSSSWLWWPVSFIWGSSSNSRDNNKNNNTNRETDAQAARWEAEQKVIRARRRRAKDLLETGAVEQQKQQQGMLALFTV